MVNKICTISIGDGWLDNDYTFYDDGKIKHYYDQHPTKHSITDWITPSQISDHKKKKILDNCSVETKSIIEKILEN